MQKLSFLLLGSNVGFFQWGLLCRIVMGWESLPCWPLDAVSAKFPFFNFRSLKFLKSGDADMILGKPRCDPWKACVMTASTLLWVMCLFVTRTDCYCVYQQLSGQEGCWSW